ncbi:hypothetical protein ACQUQU_04700 [Thalassolituus sp. LLYu03]|uniref:hypothetical protein n=1 Tax=Thalassolituus sp. LLYu03 TaxID=3421656 RepID=UPI003D29DF53
MFKYSTIIGRKLITYLLAFSFITTLAAFAFILRTDYMRGLSSFDKNLEQIRTSYQQSVSYSLWNFDFRQIEAQLSGILNFPGVVYVYIENKESVLHSAGNAYSQSDQQYSFPLEFSSAGQNYQLGTLHISMDHTGLRHEIREKAVNILVTQFFKTFSVSLFVLFIVHQLVTRRLALMSEWANQFSLRNLEMPLNTGEAQGNKDELTIVADAVNNMRKRLQQDMLDHDRNRQELENIKEQLSLAINNAAIGFCTYSANKDQWTSNSHFASQLGTTEYELESIPHPMEALVNRISGGDAMQQKERINQLLLGRLGKIHDSFLIRNFRNEERFLEVTMQTTRYQETRPAQILICVVDRTREEQALKQSRELAVSLENKVTQRTEELYNEQLRAKATIRQLEQEVERSRAQALSQQQLSINHLLLKQIKPLSDSHRELPALQALTEYLTLSTAENRSSINLARCLSDWLSAHPDIRQDVLRSHLPFSLIIEENPDMIRFLVDKVVLRDPAMKVAEQVDLYLKLVDEHVEFCAEFKLPEGTTSELCDEQKDVFALCEHVLNMRFHGCIGRTQSDDGNSIRVCFSLTMVQL